MITENRKEVPQMMNNYYNNFEALTPDEYDELMSDLYGESDMQNEIAEQAADDYLMNEIEKDAALHAADRYQLATIYANFSCKYESCNDFGAALRAAEIYSMDPSCISITIYDWKELKGVLNWSR